MVAVNTSAWRALGRTTNTAYYEIEPGILAAVPNQGAIDDKQTSAENVEFQDGHFRQLGRGGVVIIFFDRLSSQDKDARQTYGTKHDPKLLRGSALVGGTMLGRALISFFLGISKPQVPVKTFGALADAVAWARETNRIADGKEQTA